MSARGACEAAEGVLQVFRGVQRWVSGEKGGMYTLEVKQRAVRSKAVVDNGIVL